MLPRACLGRVYRIGAGSAIQNTEQSGHRVGGWGAAIQACTEVRRCQRKDCCWDVRYRSTGGQQPEHHCEVMVSWHVCKTNTLPRASAQPSHTCQTST